MVNTIQILIFMPLLSLKAPGFLYAFYMMLNDFSLLFFDTDASLIKGFDMSEILEVISFNFSLLDLETNNIILNASEIFLMFIFAVCSYFLAALL